MYGKVVWQGFVNRWIRWINRQLRWSKELGMYVMP